MGKTAGSALLGCLILAGMCVVVPFLCCGGFGALGTKSTGPSIAQPPPAASTPDPDPAKPTPEQATEPVIARPVEPPKKRTEPEKPRNNYGEANDTATQIDVKTLAKEAVLSRLKYPDDSEFAWFPDCGKTADGRWVVKGKVKAANAFGAKLTHSYGVILACTDTEKKSWRTDLVTLGDDVLYVSEEQASGNTRVPTAEEREREFAARLEEARRSQQAREERERLAALAREQAEERGRKIEEAKWRTWTATGGGFTVDAKFIRFGAGKVTLEKRDGKVITVDINILVEDDATFIREQRWLKAGE